MLTQTFTRHIFKPFSFLFLAGGHFVPPPPPPPFFNFMGPFHYPPTTAPPPSRPRRLIGHHFFRGDYDNFGDYVDYIILTASDTLHAATIFPVDMHLQLEVLLTNGADREESDEYAPLYTVMMLPRTTVYSQGDIRDKLKTLAKRLKDHGEHIRSRHFLTVLRARHFVLEVRP